VRSLKNIVAYITFKCNLACPYCKISNDRLAAKFEDLPAEAWTSWLGGFPERTVVDITGGEPFVYQGWWKLLESWPAKLQMGVTTNLMSSLVDLERFAKLVPPKFISITCSLHLHPKFNEQEFFRKLLFLRDHSILVRINYVAYPRGEYLPRLRRFSDFFSRYGFYFHVDPYIYPGEEYDAETKKLLEPYMKSVRFLGYNLEDEGKAKICNAGVEHFLVVPNGDVYRCNSGFLYHDNRVFCLGNFARGTFTPLQRPARCTAACTSGCDLDAVVMRYEGQPDFHVVGKTAQP
jgi:pyruvate-formate lyase-activating enzyme